jgi:hypothetical protein
MTFLLSLFKFIGWKTLLVGIIVVVLGCWIAYYKYKIVELELTNTELHKELLVTQQKLIASQEEVEIARHQQDVEEKAKLAINDRLTKCYQQVVEHAKSLKEIDNIMNTTEDPGTSPEGTVEAQPTVEDTETTTVTVPSITSYQNLKGLEFMNKQIDRIQTKE